MEFIQENGLLVVIGCLVLMLLFFMMVAAAALMVTRITGHGFMGPVLGTLLRALSVKNDADNEDIEDKAKPPPHRHVDIAHIKAASTQVDFERTVEKYRQQIPPAEVNPAAQVIPQPNVPISPAIAGPAELPLTPIAPPQVSEPVAVPQELPVTPVAPPEVPNSAFTPVEPPVSPDAFTQPNAAVINTIPQVVQPEIAIPPVAPPEIPTGAFPPTALELSMAPVEPPIQEFVPTESTLPLVPPTQSTVPLTDAYLQPNLPVTPPVPPGVPESAFAPSAASSEPAPLPFDPIPQQVAGTDGTPIPPPPPTLPDQPLDEKPN